MKLYLDEHIPRALEALLIEHGIDCLSTHAAGKLGVSDDEQLTFASLEHRAILTFDRKDFVKLAALWQKTGRTHAGILLSREVPLPELLRRLRRFIRHHRETELSNQVFWLSSSNEPDLS